MLNWFKGHKHSKYREILLNAFPRTLKKDVESVLDILPFKENDVKLCDGKIHKVENLIHPDIQTVNLEGELLTIPYRVYFNEPDIEKETTLTNRQKSILNCIFLRHHNGYVRQNRLEKIENNEYWITPFTFQLLGEYVIEIVEVLDEQLDDNKLENYKRFAIENSKYYQQTESRMISYWNEYYRRKFPKLKNYVGGIIFNQIKTKQIGKRLDEIIEVGIDKDERLFIRPKNERFTLIYRTATEVHWDEKELFLYSPKPREWSYLDWFRHIIDVADKECNSKLILTHRTIWTNIENELKKQIIENRKATA
ncbi:hypothetical protein SAMN05444395_107180 [Flavobacterium fryxellicola]|uniref:hypothetical protein n=1 Tax=Flavobacterium fryxellicola TaxID=249352 RepID=UPI000826FC90|nr:hypothetical protein [Flavobacterium fryxellicola]SHN73176.1 hypothetical protein SAMN05444395_107180 [Flavobacterium fryxellicola]